MKSVIGDIGKKRLSDCYGLTALAKAIGRSRNVKVIFDNYAKTASTDGKTITLPRFSSFGSKEQYTLMNALLDHECGHVRFTNFELWKERIRIFELRYGRNSAMIFKGFMNSIEDYWMEIAFTKIYPGCRKNIMEGVPHLIDAHFYDFDPSMDSNPHNDIHAYVLLALCARCYGHPTLVANASSYKAKVIERFGTELETQVSESLAQADICKSTAEAADLAEQIFLLIKDSQEPSVQEIIHSASLENCEDLGDKLVSAVQQISQSEGDQSEAVTGAPADDYYYETEVTTYEEREHQILLDQTRDTELSNSMVKAQHIIAPAIGRSVERRITDLIQSRLETGCYFRNSGRNLASSRIAGVQTGNYDVFRVDEEADGINTAFSLVLDTSTSMNELSMSNNGVQNTSPLAALLPVYWQIGAALSANDVPFNVWTFGSYVALYKSFDATWQKTRGRSMHMTGSTSTDVAIHEATQSLLTRPESKRVIILITDGVPNCLNHTMSEIAFAQKAGIKVVLLFLGKTNPLHSGLKAYDVIAPLCTTTEDITQAFSEAVELAIAE